MVTPDDPLGSCVSAIEINCKGGPAPGMAPGAMPGMAPGPAMGCAVIWKRPVFLLKKPLPPQACWRKMKLGRHQKMEHPKISVHVKYTVDGPLIYSAVQVGVYRRVYHRIIYQLFLSLAVEAWSKCNCKSHQHSSAAWHKLKVMIKSSIHNICLHLCRISTSCKEPRRRSQRRRHSGGGRWGAQGGQISFGHSGVGGHRR